jgi:hypothetical protein
MCIICGCGGKHAKIEQSIPRKSKTEPHSKAKPDSKNIRQKSGLKTSSEKGPA